MAKRGAYDDELTDEERAAIAAADQSNELPPAEDDDEQNAPPADPAPAPAAEEKKPAEKPKPAEEPKAAAEAEPKPAAEAQPAQPAQDEEARFTAFMEKHKDKSPEELARLAFQQSARANKGEATARVAGQNLQQLADRAKAAIERRNSIATGAVQKKTGFREKLQSDPDAATAEIHDRLVEREVAEADAEVDQALVEQAIGFASAHIPDFGNRWDGMKSLATEMGYTPQEIAGIRDGRDIVMLSLAQISANLIKAGVIDVSGNLRAQAEPTTEATDPRLTAPDAAQTLGSGGNRANGGGKTPEEQLQDLLNLSDADFDKLDPAQLESIMRAAG